MPPAQKPTKQQISTRQPQFQRIVRSKATTDAVSQPMQSPRPATGQLAPDSEIVSQDLKRRKVSDMELNASLNGASGIGSTAGTMQAKAAEQATGLASLLGGYHSDAADDSD